MQEYFTAHGREFQAHIDQSHSHRSWRGGGPGRGSSGFRSLPRVPIWNKKYLRFWILTFHASDAPWGSMCYAALTPYLNLLCRLEAPMNAQGTALCMQCLHLNKSSAWDYIRLKWRTTLRGASPAVSVAAIQVLPDHLSSEFLNFPLTDLDFDKIHGVQKALPSACGHMLPTGLHLWVSWHASHPLLSCHPAFYGMRRHRAFLWKSAGNCHLFPYPDHNPCPCICPPFPGSWQIFCLRGRASLDLLFRPFPACIIFPVRSTFLFKFKCALKEIQRKNWETSDSGLMKRLHCAATSKDNQGHFNCPLSDCYL